MAFKYLDLDVKLNAGDLLMFPSNFVATHEVKEVTKGSRYSYLANFAQGSSAPDRNVVVQETRESGTQGKSWLPDIAKDFKELLEKEGKPIPPVLTRLPDHGR